MYQSKVSKTCQIQLHNESITTLVLWSCTRCHPREVRNQCSQSEPMQHLPCAQYRVDKRGDFGACTTAKPRINLADWRSQYTPLATSSARRQCGYHTKHGATPTVLGGLLGHIRMRSLHAAVRVHAETAVILPDVARTGCQDRRLLQTPYSCSCLTISGSGSRLQASLASHSAWAPAIQRACDSAAYLRALIR